ncbi:MAG: glycoside hydrolase family 15 protein [Thermoplasmata archaeon]|nr:glycoside hydrolase family 15 protein [Thermoplasmata archaeon]
MRSPTSPTEAAHPVTPIDLPEEEGNARTDPGPLSAYDYGVIGNQQTAALVSRHGSVDWACFPRFDSPSVFARLLDRQMGGFHEVRPAKPYLSHQQYVHGTNLLATFFELDRGSVLTVTDLMPAGPTVRSSEGEPRIIRRLEARGGPVEVRIEAVPQFDYARCSASWTISRDAAVAEASPARMVFTAPWAWSLRGKSAVSGGTVVPGTPLYVQLRWGEDPDPEPSPAQLLSGTDAYWRAWVSPPEAPLRRVAARWMPWVERSELILKLLSPSDSGVFVAAPTTSLPEWPGGSRNWDYRYVWIRDAAFTAQVFLLLGHVNEARSYVDWALTRAAELPPSEDLRVVYRADGGPIPDEVELRHLEGYGGARPVRIGNAAFGQRQHDIYGEILDSAFLLERVDPAFVRSHWATLEKLADRTTELWSLPDSGIWEIRGPPAHHVHSKLMCWVALDRAIRLAEIFGETGPVERWRRVEAGIRATILARGYDEGRQSFVQAFDRPGIDASALRIPVIGFLPPTDPRVISTIRAIERSLGQGDFLKRYDGDDHLDGPEGTFLLCSFWHVEALARCGERHEALRIWRSLLDAAGPLLLFSEEFDPAQSRPLGNYPQAFTHIGVLRAALALGLVRSHH